MNDVRLKDKELKEVEQVREAIQSLVKTLPMAVSNAEQNLAAKTAIITIRKESKAREAWFYEHILSHTKKAYTEAKAAYDAHRDVLKELLRPMKEWTTSTDQNIARFEQAERDRLERDRRREEDKYRKRMETAEAKGKDPASVKPAKLVLAPPKSVKTAGGTYTVKTNKVVVILDASIVPEQFWIRTLNRGLIESELRQGREVPGCLLRDQVGSAVR